MEQEERFYGQELVIFQTVNHYPTHLDTLTVFQKFQENVTDPLINQIHTPLVFAFTVLIIIPISHVNQYTCSRSTKSINK